MTTVTIHDDSQQAQAFIEFVKTLPFVEVESKKRSFEEAVAECGGVITSQEYFDGVRTIIKEHFQKNA